MSKTRLLDTSTNLPPGDKDLADGGTPGRDAHQG